MKYRLDNLSVNRIIAIILSLVTVLTFIIYNNLESRPDGSSYFWLAIALIPLIAVTIVFMIRSFTSSKNDSKIKTLIKILALTITIPLVCIILFLLVVFTIGGF